jgi:hypothetical protein
MGPEARKATADCGERVRQRVGKGRAVDDEAHFGVESCGARAKKTAHAPGAFFFPVFFGFSPTQ